MRRIPADSVNPRAKNYHWGDFTAGLFEATDAGYETVVLLDHAGNVTEGPGFNVFAVTEGRVVTPATTESALAAKTKAMTLSPAI